MPNYKESKIYKLWCPDNDLVYIGSTCDHLYKRLSHHKADSVTRRYCTSRVLFDSGSEVKIELVEKFPCDDKMELRKREGELIRAMACVNKLIAGRTAAEYQKLYREENTDRLKEQKKQYYKMNTEKINTQKQVKIMCACGGHYSKNHKARHLKSNKHINNL